MNFLRRVRFGTAFTAGSEPDNRGTTNGDDRESEKLPGKGHCPGAHRKPSCEAHPFTAPTVMPSTKYFWAAKNNTSDGASAIVDIASI